MNPKLARWRVAIFASTWLCYAGFYFARKPWSVAKSTLGHELHLDGATIGDLGAAYLIAYTVGQFLAGGLGNRLGPRVTLLAGMMVALLANAAFGIADSPATFTVLMILNGLAQATGWSGTVGTMASWFRREERGKVMGIWATNFQAGPAIASFVASAALGAAGYRWSFFAGSLVLLGVWAFFLFFQRNRPEDVGLPPVEVEPASADGEGDSGGLSRAAWVNVLLCGTFYFFVKFVRYALTSWAPFLLERNFHIAAADAGYLSTTFEVAGVFGVIAAGWLSDLVFGSRRTGVSTLMILGMTGACVLMLTAGASSAFLFSTCLGLIGFTLYGPDALMTGAGAMDIGSRRGAALAAGVINGMGSVGAVVQELVIGRLYDAKGGDVGPILILLVGASIGASIVIGVMALRTRAGRSDV